MTIYKAWKIVKTKLTVLMPHITEEVPNLVMADPFAVEMQSGITKQKLANFLKNQNETSYCK